MTDAEKIEMIIKALEAEDPKDIFPAAVLADIPEWDSMGMINTIMMLSDNFGREVEHKDLKELATIGDLMSLMER